MTTLNNTNGIQIFTQSPYTMKHFLTINNIDFVQCGNGFKMTRQAISLNKDLLLKSCKICKFSKDLIF